MALQIWYQMPLMIEMVTIKTTTVFTKMYEFLAEMLMAVC